MSIRDKLFERDNRAVQAEIKVSTKEVAAMRSLIRSATGMSVDTGVAALHNGT